MIKRFLMKTNCYHNNYPKQQSISRFIPKREEILGNISFRQSKHFIVQYWKQNFCKNSRWTMNSKYNLLINANSFLKTNANYRYNCSLLLCADDNSLYLDGIFINIIISARSTHGIKAPKKINNTLEVDNR